MEREERLTVAEAAEVLGTTDGAIRKRVARGTMRSERDAEGRVLIVLDAATRREAVGQPGGQTAGQPGGQGPSELVDELRDRVSYLERQVEEEREARRRADIMLSRLMDRLPELEAPQEGRQEPVQAQERTPEGQDASETRVGRQEAAQGPEARPWWRRIFRS